MQRVQRFGVQSLLQTAVFCDAGVVATPVLRKIETPQAVLQMLQGHSWDGAASRRPADA